jgi:hypothetical protein
MVRTQLTFEFHNSLLSLLLSLFRLRICGNENNSTRTYNSTSVGRRNGRKERKERKERERGRENIGII